MLNRAVCAIVTLILAVFVSVPAAGAEPPYPDPPPRLIIIKVDGLSGTVLEAAFNPNGPEVSMLPHPEQFREAHQWYRNILGREVLLPNLQAYFVRDGVRTTAMYASTLTVSAPAWAAIDSGQPSVVKNSFYINRASGELQNYLDGLRENWGPLLRRSGKTGPVWQLDLLGIPLLLDAFDPERTWSALQLIFRDPSGRQLSSFAEYLLTAGQRQRGIGSLARGHLSSFVHQPDMPEINDQALARLSRTLILEDDAERFDLLNLFFPTIDHQFHVDPNYRNILNWMIKIDGWFGEIMSAVEQSGRRDRTIVALVTDHGHDFNPVALNYAFPITQWLRDSAFGGHTVLLPFAENADHALTVPFRGVDFARVYESPHSPYGSDVPHGEKGFYTAFAANYGNSRFDAYLRNSDLNELHLLLLDILRFRSDDRRLETIFPVFQNTISAMRDWLIRDLEQSRAAIQALSNFRQRFSGQGSDNYARDAVSRLTQEIQGYERQSGGLQALLSIPSEWTQWIEWARRGYTVSNLIPRGYLGPGNRLDQLMNYVVGWEEGDQVRWTSGHPAFRHVDYPQVIGDFRTTNPNAYGTYHPFHFFSAGIPPEEIDIQGLEDDDRPLRQAIWLQLGGRRGELLLLESVDGDIRYLPVSKLTAVNGRYIAMPDEENDPLGCPAARQYGTWLAPRQWAEQCGTASTSVLPVIMSDLFRPNHETFLQSDLFRERISNQLLDADAHIRALRYRFQNGLPDFRVWMNRGWNANSREHIPGGTHGGFSPLETRTVFAVWAGDRVPIDRGKTVTEPHFTTDIVPTLFNMMGLLNEDGTVQTDSGVEFPPLPGRPVPVAP